MKYPRKTVSKERAINRRDFLRYSAVGSSLSFSEARVREPHLWTGTNRLQSSRPTFELEEATIAQLQERLTSGELTARSITELYLARINELDKNPSGLHSILEINPDVLEIADSLDRERQQKGSRGPLHGIPVLLKDNIDTADRMKTSAGSLALLDSTPPRDSFVAHQLRKAGAVLLGKTNLSEWANFRSTRSSSGWSARGGQCRNPYVIDRNPCGSSSGSGVSVSANLSAVAIGTETDGSIVCPSSANGIVGIKPTVGLISRAGIIPISHSQDTAGPMARTVTDAVTVLDALVGIDSRDSTTNKSRGRSHLNYKNCLDVYGFNDARIGVARNFLGFSHGVNRLMEAAITQMQRLGATIIDPINLSNMAQMAEAEREVLLYEFKTDLNIYLKQRSLVQSVTSLQKLIEFNETNRDLEMPYFEQEIFVESATKGPLSNKDYQSALSLCTRLSRAEGIDRAVTTHKLDAIVAPTGGPAWTTDLINGERFYTESSSRPAAVAGYPNITLPMGNIFGLPVGISFFGQAWSEPTLIKLAFAFEQATRFRQTPNLLATANLDSANEVVSE